MKLSAAVLIAVSLFTLMFSPSISVQACSGGMPNPLMDLLQSASIVVKARVLDVDATGQAGVVEVIEYLVGAGEQNLLLVTQFPNDRLSTPDTRQVGPGSCAMSVPPLQLDEVVYLFLIRNFDGSYSTSIRSNMFNYETISYRFPTPDATALVGLRESTPSGEWAVSEFQQVNEGEFRRLVFEYSGSVPAFPTRTDPYPMPAPVLVTTASGEGYLLPVDYTPPVRLGRDDLQNLRRRNSVWRRGNLLGVTGCNVVGCRVYSPNGETRAVLTSDGVQIDSWLIPGEAFLFSATNELIAVWNGDQLEFYTFYYPHLGMWILGHELLFTQAIHEGAQWKGQASWSPDGLLLAYSDAAGLWLLNVYSGDTRLLIPSDASGSATARYFSPTGRYFAFTTSTGSTRTLDLIMGAVLPDGIFSPGERFFLAFDTSQPVSPHYLCALSFQDPCADLGMGQDAIWIEEGVFMRENCTLGDAAACNVIRNSTSFYSPADLGGTRGFDYDLTTRTTLLLRNPQQVTVIDSFHTQEYEIVPWITEEIASIEWLPTTYTGQRTFGETVIEHFDRWLQSMPIPQV